MSKELDTSWFDLKKYDKLNELDLRGWHRQLEIRSVLLWLNENAKETADLWRDSIKNNPIISNYDDEFFSYKERFKKYPFNTSTVESMSAIDWYFLGLKDERFSDIFECCELYAWDDTNHEKQELINTPIDIIFKDKGIDTEWHYNHVIVNLRGTDEQIINDFCHWLTEYRKAMGYKTHKKNFTDKDLSEWIEYRLLPYIDLMLVAKLEGKLITLTQVAKFIYPDYDDIKVDPTERLRRTIKPKAEWLLKEEIVSAINEQLRM